MKRFYSRFRVVLMTLALGLASVNFFNWFNDYWYEIPVNLPEVVSDSPIIVLPRRLGESPHIGGGGSGSGSDCNCGGGGAGEFYEERKKRAKNQKNKILHLSNESIRKSN